MIPSSPAIRKKNNHFVSSNISFKNPRLVLRVLALLLLVISITCLVCVVLNDEFLSFMVATDAVVASTVTATDTATDTDTAIVGSGDDHIETDTDTIQLDSNPKGDEETNSISEASMITSTTTTARRRRTGRGRKGKGKYYLHDYDHSHSYWHDHPIYNNKGQEKGPGEMKSSSSSKRNQSKDYVNGRYRYGTDEWTKYHGDYSTSLWHQHNAKGKGGKIKGKGMDTNNKKTKSPHPDPSLFPSPLSQTASPSQQELFQGRIVINMKGASAGERISFPGTTDLQLLCFDKIPLYDLFTNAIIGTGNNCFAFTTGGASDVVRLNIISETTTFDLDNCDSIFTFVLVPDIVPTKKGPLGFIVSTVGEEPTMNNIISGCGLSDDINASMRLSGFIMVNATNTTFSFDYIYVIDFKNATNVETL